MTARRVGIVLTTALAILSVWTSPAYAYLDPGTGSLILQSILGLIAGALIALRVYWGRIKQFFRGRRMAKPTEGPGRDKD